MWLEPSTTEIKLRKKKLPLNGCKLTAAFLEILKGTPNSGKGKGPTARSSNYKEKVLRNQEDKELARKYFKRGMEEMKEEAGLVTISILFCWLFTIRDLSRNVLSLTHYQGLCQFLLMVS